VVGDKISFVIKTGGAREGDKRTKSKETSSTGNNELNAHTHVSKCCNTRQSRNGKSGGFISLGKTKRKPRALTKSNNHKRRSKREILGGK